MDLVGTHKVCGGPWVVWKKLEESGRTCGIEIWPLDKVWWLVIVRSHAQKYFNRLEREHGRQFNGLKS